MLHSCQRHSDVLLYWVLPAQESQEISVSLLHFNHLKCFPDIGYNTDFISLKLRRIVGISSIKLVPFSSNSFRDDFLLVLHEASNTGRTGIV